MSVPFRIIPVCPGVTSPMGVGPAPGCNSSVRCHCARSACGARGWGFASCELSKPSCIVLSVIAGVAAARRYQLACQACLLPSETLCTFTNESSLNHVQRASSSCLNICLGCALLPHWIPSALSGPSWAGGAWAPASGWGTGLGVWRWRARLLTQYHCQLEWDWVRQHGLVGRAWLWASSSERPWAWILALLLAACPWIWYL